MVDHGDPNQLRLGLADLTHVVIVYEYAVLITSLRQEILTFAQRYRAGTRGGPYRPPLGPSAPRRSSVWRRGRRPICACLPRTAPSRATTAATGRPINGGCWMP